MESNYTLYAQMYIGGNDGRNVDYGRYPYRGCDYWGLCLDKAKQMKPVFCPGCRNRDTFERQPKKDVRSAEDDRTLWEAWVCKICGYKALNEKKGKDT